MSPSIGVVQKTEKKKRGRPAIAGHGPVTAIRLSPELRAKVDKWRQGQEGAPPRSEAIRSLIEVGLRHVK